MICLSLVTPLVSCIHAIYRCGKDAIGNTGVTGGLESTYNITPEFTYNITLILAMHSIDLQYTNIPLLTERTRGLVYWKRKWIWQIVFKKVIFSEFPTDNFYFPRTKFLMDTCLFKSSKIMCQTFETAVRYCIKLCTRHFHMLTDTFAKVKDIVVNNFEVNQYTKWLSMST